MLKIVAKCAFAAAVASFALGGMSTVSYAAKKKPAKAATCKAPAWCAANCAGGVCVVNWCGADGKWYPGGWCAEPFCTVKC